MIIPAGDLDIFYEETGKGPCVLFIHGWAGSSSCWRAVSALLLGYRCIAVDLKGHGESSKPADGAYRVSDQAQVVLAAMRELELHDVVLVGHSLGGAVAMTVAAQLERESRRSVRGLVLMDAICFPQRIPPLLQLLRLPALGEATAAVAPARLVVQTSFRLSYHDPTRITQEVVAEHVRCMDLPGARAALLATARAMADEPVWKLTPHINVPALVLWGRHDSRVPLSLGRQLAEALPYGRLEVVDRCGHYPLKERPPETAQLMETWLHEVF